MTTEPVSLLELNRRVSRALLSAPGLTGVWVTGETSDLRVSGGHCYMELLQKDDNGSPLAKARAVVWASTYAVLAARFEAATGCRLRSDMKILVRVNVNFHAVYGFSLVINDIDPDYTVGDLARKRNAIIAKLKEEGVYDLNRSLPWPSVPWRVAVVSARGAAGYGDFVRHLHVNPARLRFSTSLFEANMQGEHTVSSVVAALDAIMARVDDFDCVVIIRGGGAVADLAWFDDYELALNVASFPLPVIVGIGHERDITVLDYVANTRVKTPTAAAEALIGRVGDAYTRLTNVGNAILDAAKTNIGTQKQQLAYYSGLLPALAQNAIERQRQRIGLQTAQLIATATRNTMSRSRQRLDALGELLEALSPEATLRRGYSITRVDGHAVTDSTLITVDTVLETQFAKGRKVISIVANG